MNCYLHADLPATAYCRSCGKPLCDDCQRSAQGTIYCQEHAPAPAANPPVNPQNPYTQPLTAAVPPVVPANVSPALAFLLGFIPGVGAIYNGQYLKGLVHAIIFGFLISILNPDGRPPGGAPMIAIILTAFIFYMPFEAYHTAKRRLLGQPVEEFSSIIASQRFRTRTPVGPVLLILLGVLFLLDTLHLIEFQELARFWPVLLIVAGAFMLYNRISSVSSPVVEHSPEYVEPRQ